MTSMWELLNLKEGRLSELARAQPEVSRVEFKRRCDSADAVLEAAERLWVRKDAVDADLRADLARKRLTLLGAFMVAGLVVHYFETESRTFGIGLSIVFGCIAGTVAFIIERRRSVARQEVIADSEDQLLTLWRSTGGQADNFWQLRTVHADQRNSDHMSADTEEWRKASALIDAEKRNLLLNSHYSMLCECRLIGNWSNDGWSNRLPNTSVPRELANAPSQEIPPK